MSEWDVTALAALHDCKQELEDREVVRWLRDATRAMWRPNAERYEPSHLFDTPRGVAGLAWENLRERMLAEYRADRSPWRSRGVHLTVPHGSLLLRAGDLAVHVIKAPGVRLREPEWSRFAWDTSATRHAAAVRNAGIDALPLAVLELVERYVDLPPVRLPSVGLPAHPSEADIAEAAQRARSELAVGAGPVPHVVRLLEAHGA